LLWFAERDLRQLNILNVISIVTLQKNKPKTIQLYCCGYYHNTTVDAAFQDHG
jgi:hypothetical protein